MATFIPSQPLRTAVAAAQEKPVRLPPSRQFRVPNALPRSWQRTGWRPLEHHSTVETVDLTGPDEEDVIPERQAARDAAEKSTIANGSANGSLNRGLTNGDGAAGLCPGADAGVRPGDNRDSPIVVDDDKPDDDQPDPELDATASEDDDEQTLVATPPADRDGSHSSLPAIPAEPFAIGPSVQSAAGSAANGVSRDDLGDIERERPSTRQAYDPSRPHGEVADAEVGRDTPQPAAPASAGHIHDIFAEDEKTFGEASMRQKSRERKQQGQPSSRPTDSIRDGTLALTSASGELVLDERSTEDPDHTTSRKRSGPSVGPHTPLESGPLPKRPRRSGMVTQKAREVGETSAGLHSHEEETLLYALRLPRYCRGNDWEVVDIDGVYLEEDGSLSCKLLWEPTMALVSSLNGALLERAEELAKKEYGAEVWKKWLEKQGTMGRRRHKGGKVQGGN